MTKEKTLKDYRPAEPSPKDSILKSGLKKLIGMTGYNLSKIPPETPAQGQEQIEPHHFFDLYFSLVKPEDFFFIQLGANDGKSRDRMHSYIKKYNLSGILVEPQKDIFEKLKQNYQGHANLSFCNVAIAEKNGTETFYRVKDSLITDVNFFETTAISSLDKEITKLSIKKRIDYGVIENISDNLNDYIEEMQVNTLTFAELLKMNRVNALDFLFMDCDGFDHKIINMIDFDIISPKVINYESCVLSDNDRQQCESLLQSKGYQTFRHGNDTCAFKS